MAATQEPLKTQSEAVSSGGLRRATIEAIPYPKVLWEENFAKCTFIPTTIKLLRGQGECVSLDGKKWLATTKGDLIFEKNIPNFDLSKDFTVEGTIYYSPKEGTYLEKFQIFIGKEGSPLSLYLPRSINQWKWGENTPIPNEAGLPDRLQGQKFKFFLKKEGELAHIFINDIRVLTTQVDSVALKALPKINFQAPTCKFLTDMTPEEVLQAVVKEWGYTHRGNIYVKALNAVVELNKEPYLAHPLDLRNNPTEVKEGQKKWIDEKKLPRRLYLLCEKGYVNVVNPDPKNYREENYHYLDLYPVKLEIAREGEIKILSVNKVSSSDVEIVFKIYPYVEKALYIDIETLNPKEMALKNCPVAYLGGYLYTGPIPNESYREAPYTPMLSTGPDKRFYLAIFLPDPQDTFKAYLRVDYYCAKTPKTKISLLNPEEGEKSPLQTSYWLNYTHKNYLQNFGLSEITLKLRLVSSEGYYSDPFEISLP